MITSTNAISLEEYETALRQEYDSYKSRLNDLKVKLKEFQKTCPHNRKHMQFYPDPSGNNDSFNECRMCGMQF